MKKSNNEVPKSELFPDECRPLAMCWEINRVNLSRGCRNLCQFCQVCDLSSVIINKIHNPSPSQARSSQDAKCRVVKLRSIEPHLDVKWTILNWLRTQWLRFESLSDGNTLRSLRPSEILWLMVKLLMEIMFIMKIWAANVSLYSIYLHLSRINVSSIPFLCQQ